MCANERPSSSSDGPLSPSGASRNAGRPDLSRRELVKLGALGVGAATVGGAAAGYSLQARSGSRRDPAPPPFAAPPMDEVRIGFVGIGGMGSVHVRHLLNIDGVRLKALCDIRSAHAERARDWTIEAGRPEPRLYTRGEWDFVRMCEEEELDLVFNVTPWRWHGPICVAAMENEKHAATEVPAAYRLDDCWKLVQTAESQQKHCVMMENVNYGRWEMLVLHMVRGGCSAKCFTAALSAVCELSERSVAKGSRPEAFPHFTRGRWQTNPPRAIVGA